ncbi:5-oxoprolinase subunit C family protein [Nocardia stercoris]|uniref:Biotin-dependent carboxyltransferase n=1 Tax=Nocardia stercoris TaxID=2483361 RepID=A0A3M2L3M1_9NOCA|nr:biotin-dependent carboxyltransferase family protein [Nocardia stercoris]RMI32302.1 biotin-dependent carboxyltransferase [Nocardia stercoris]
MTELRVVRSGTLCTVQDLGRPGWFHAGVGVSGAADRRSLTLANRLVGNDESAAVLECLLGGMEVETAADAVLAVTGAPVPLTVDGRAEPTDSVLFLRAGQRMRIGVASAGLRCYVAVRGGVDVPPVLGSRSRDTLAGLGPEPLRAGAVVPIGRPGRGWPNVDVAPVPPVTSGPVTARVILGPRDDWFRRPRDLFAGSWRVSTDTDRVGARLDRVSGPALTRLDAGELPTEGMALGAIQVPPSGQPVVFLADHPITGGYPVIGTVVADDVDLLAQARPGQRIVFRPAPAWG